MQGDPEQFTEPLEKCAVAIDGFGRTQENLQIADEMPDDETEEHETSNGDNPFSSDGRGGEAKEWIHE